MAIESVRVEAHNGRALRRVIQELLDVIQDWHDCADRYDDVIERAKEAIR